MLVFLPSHAVTQGDGGSEYYLFGNSLAVYAQITLDDDDGFSGISTLFCPYIIRCHPLDSRSVFRISSSRHVTIEDIIRSILPV